jgi:transcriptional regulator with XRE-family HTH domain
VSSSRDSDLSRLAASIGAALHAHRAERGMSLGELSRASGLSRAILARIEGGAGNPSIETLWRVSRALDLPLGALLAEDQDPLVRVLRARGGKELHADSGMRMWLLHAEGRERRSEMYELVLEKGDEQRSDAHLPGTEEVLICITGRVRIGPLGDDVELRAGDAVWFAADRPHRYAAVTDTRLIGWMLYGSAGQS